MTTIRINGTTRDVDTDPQMPLLWAVRDILGLTGTKFGCGIHVASRAVNPNCRHDEASTISLDCMGAT